MVTIWHLKGLKAGQFEQVEQSQADKLIDSKQAQLVEADGEPLRFPENHPQYKPERKRRAYKTKVIEAE